MPDGAFWHHIQASGSLVMFMWLPAGIVVRSSAQGSLDARRDETSVREPARIS